MVLNGIDVSSWQEDLVPADMATTDFVIVKATGGTGYANPAFKRHADATLDAGKLLGCYHYARERGCAGSAEAEADYFIKAFKPYAGKAIPFLDWEADALSLGPSWALAWLDRVEGKTGVAPGIYMSKSTLQGGGLVGRGREVPALVGAVPGLRGDGIPERPLDRRRRLRGLEGTAPLPVCEQWRDPGVRRAPGPEQVLREQVGLEEASAERKRGGRGVEWG